VPDFVVRQEEHFGEGAVAKVLSEHDAALEQKQLKLDM
jgi:hypothetical protein